MLKVLVSREGTALKVEVAHSSGYATLDKAATEAVKTGASFRRVGHCSRSMNGCRYQWHFV